MNIDISELIKILINKLSKEIWVLLSGIFILMTYWFVCIYFISPYFYQNNNNYIIIILCFVLSVNWLAAHIVLTILKKGLNIVRDSISDNESIELEIQGVFIISILNSLFYLIAPAFLFYLFRTKYHFLTFSHLVLLINSLIFAVLLLTLSKYLYQKDKLQKKQERKLIEEEIEKTQNN